MIVDDRKRVIGKVISVQADRFSVELLGSTDNFTVVGYDDIHYVARLSSYVIIPVQADYVIAEVIGLREREGAPQPKERDFAPVDKTDAAKYLDVVPIGMLPRKSTEPFKFGVSLFPALYADVLYVLDSELDRIFEVADAIIKEDGSSETRLKSLSIGRSTIFKDYDIKIGVDAFFGGHSAILGNTGSGKSCTVATILQSLFEKPDEYAARGASFVIFDVNGEYRVALSELSKKIKRHYFRVAASFEADGVITALDKNEITETFRLPHWFLNAEEWELLLRASERTQQPVLRAALGLTTLFIGGGDEEKTKLQNDILARCIVHIIQSDNGTATKTDRIKGMLSTFNTTEISLAKLGAKLVVSYGEMKDAAGIVTYVTSYIQEAITLPAYQNEPFAFDVLERAFDLALLYEEAHGNNQIREYCSQMITRFKSVRERPEFAFLRGDPVKQKLSISQFVEKLVGLEVAGKVLRKKAQLVIIDMNEAEDEAVEVAAAVVSRLIFDRLRRADPRNRFPVNLVLEEAHRYVSEQPPRHAIDASRIFQRIAKEGRKYGMFLMLASQRPSELSKTVLSQCSNFLVHRIQNPDDLFHIRQMTPFISENVLKRLPSLPKQFALIFGNAVNLPASFKVRNVKPRPKSDDAKISEIWFHADGAAAHLNRI